MNASPNSCVSSIAQRLNHLPQELGNNIFVVPEPDFGHKYQSAKVDWYKNLWLVKAWKQKLLLSGLSTLL